MIRPSQLASSCGLAPRLAEQFPTTSEASERGTRLHAEFARALAGAPGPFSPGIADAAFEVRALVFPGYTMESERPCKLMDPETGDLITEGTADVVIRTDANVVYVIDLKTGRQIGTQPAAENLQVAAYALAVALELGARAYIPGILWLDHESGTVELERAAPVPESEWWDVLDRLRAAASRAAVPTQGPHCTECRSRMHCPAYLLPAHEGPSALVPFTQPGGLTAENAARALVVVEALEDAAKTAKELLRTFARDNGGIRDGDRVWAPSMRKGRASFDQKALAADLPEVFERYLRTGAPHEAFSWKKVRAHER